MLHVYGIPNCNAVKKACQWLQDKQVDYEFHDFKKEGVSLKQLTAWSKLVKWESLLNKKGTTWRKFSEEQQAAATTKAGAFALMVANPSVIKRPVVVVSSTVMVIGFDEQLFAEKII
jgi:arsenate reductase